MYLSNKLNISDHNQCRNSQKIIEEGKWIITTSQTFLEDWNFYSNSWHRQFGPKVTVRNKKIEFKRKWGKGFQRLEVDLNSWSGDFVAKAVRKLKLEPNKPKFNLKIRLDKAYDAELLGIKRGYKFYQRTLIGIPCDYVIESPSGVIYHDDNYENLTKGLRKKIKKTSQPPLKPKRQTIVNWHTCKVLGFCDQGIFAFCSAFDLDSDDDYKVSEIFSRVLNNKELAQPFLAELQTLARSVNYKFNW